MLYFLANTGCEENLKVIISFLRSIYLIFQIAIPVLLILFGTIDLGKAVMAGEEKEIKAATEMLLKRAIAAIAVFLLFVVVKYVTGIVGGTEWRDCWSEFDPKDLKSDATPYVERINI